MCKKKLEKNVLRYTDFSAKYVLNIWDNAGLCAFWPELKCVLNIRNYTRFCGAHISRGATETFTNGQTPPPTPTAFFTTKIGRLPMDGSPQMPTPPPHPTVIKERPHSPQSARRVTEGSDLQQLRDDLDALWEDGNVELNV